MNETKMGSIETGIEISTSQLDQLEAPFCGSEEEKDGLLNKKYCLRWLSDDGLQIRAQRFTEYSKCNVIRDRPPYEVDLENEQTYGFSVDCAQILIKPAILVVNSFKWNIFNNKENAKIVQQTDNSSSIKWPIDTDNSIDRDLISIGHGNLELHPMPVKPMSILITPQFVSINGLIEFLNLSRNNK